MISKSQKIRSFLSEDDGTTAVEYAVMLGLIILACIGSIVTLGGSSGSLWGDTLSEITSHFGN